MTRALRVGPMAAMLGVLALTGSTVAPAAQAQDASLPGTITEFPTGKPGTAFGIVTGPDGAIWFTNYTQRPLAA